MSAKTVTHYQCDLCDKQSVKLGDIIYGAGDKNHLCESHMKEFIKVLSSGDTQHLLVRFRKVYVTKAIKKFLARGGK